ncbi:MAG: carbamoyltransferase N-terminal domain-containing protein, partial [Vicingaceae bacterium]
MFRSYRQIIAYDPFLGHKYIPELCARIRYGKGAYFIETDKYGFRNSPFPRQSKLTILLLGDSYAAGDGVANSDRFSDIIENNYDCNIINLAVNGYGVDQQILAYEMYKDQIPHDMVLFMPHMDDLYRNTRTNRLGKNRMGKDILIPKPYFEIIGDQLVLKNQPVPLERPSSNELTPAPHETHVIAETINKNKNALKHLVNRTLKKHVVGKLSFQELNDHDSQEWNLMNRLIARLKILTDSKTLVIAPIPYNYVVMEKEPQYYMPFFTAHEDDRTKLIDLLPSLQKTYDQHQDETYLPLCGHFTAITHSEVGHVLGEHLAKVGIKKKNKNQPEPHTSKTGYVLGISCYYHDAAAAIVKDGEIIGAAQEERFTRKKHDPGFPANAIHYCLEEARIDINDLTAICYYDNEALSIERVLNNYSSIPLSKKELFWLQAEQGIARKLKLRSQLRDIFDYQGQLTKTHHHHAHASSAFYPSPFEKAAILVVDGVGEWACSSIGIGKGSEVSIIQQQDYPDSLGLLYSAITYFCGFKVNSGEYKLMGLAPYGKPSYADLFKEYLIDIKSDGSIRLNLDYFGFHHGEPMTNDQFDQLIGGSRRQAESRITRREMDLAASIQLVTEEVLMKMLVHAHALTGMNNCVMAGGVALNCVANGKLLTNGPFSEIWIQPASNN